MKKEGLIAIIFGIILGGILGLIILDKNRKQQLERSKTIAPQQKNNLLTPKTMVNLQSLEITQPEDRIIVSESKIIIQGTAGKDSLIVIQSPIKDIIFKNDNSQFKINFPLSLGENVINITVYPKEPQFRSQEKQLRIYYLSEEL